MPAPAPSFVGAVDVSGLRPTPTAVPARLPLLAVAPRALGCTDLPRGRVVRRKLGANAFTCVVDKDKLNPATISNLNRPLAEAASAGLGMATKSPQGPFRCRVPTAPIKVSLVSAGAPRHGPALPAWRLTPGLFCIVHCLCFWRALG